LNTEYLECACHSPEHTLRFILDEDLYVSVFLQELPWRERLVAAVKYLFGYKCRYGHFEEIIVDKRDCGRIISILEEFRDS
jgi:hypothetical protein